MKVLKQKIKGFSLMEVLVAIIILAMSFTTLILAQSRAINLAIKSKNISIATQLARLKLLECEQEIKKQISSASDINIVGDFKKEGIEDFKWECHAPKFNMKPPSAAKMDSIVKKEAESAGAGDKSPNLNVTSQVMEMITNGLGESIRELCVIIRWQEGVSEEEFRVVTHISDLNAMARLSFMFNQAAPKTKEEPNKKPQGKPDEQKP